MEYYLQILFGLIALVAVVIPLSTNVKAIKFKNIAAAILVMILFGNLSVSLHSSEDGERVRFPSKIATLKGFIDIDLLAKL